MSKSTRHSLLLVLTALIWGIAFVAQSEGGNAVGPYSFNCVRSLIGSAVLVPVILLLRKLNLSKPSSSPRQLWLGGISCGVILCLSSNLQQLGIYLGTPAGKAGFLTACYIILVPLVGLFFHKKCHWNVWLGVLLTTIGLYLLCMTTSLTFQLSDILLLLCALGFTFHILVIDHFSPLVDGVAMSCIQFLISGLLSAIPMLFFELLPNFSSWLDSFKSMNAWIPILYAGICSCGIAYTLQIIGQDGVNPTIASLLMSLESVFSVLAGLVLLHQALSMKELFGCIFIFSAIVLAQLPIQDRR